MSWKRTQITGEEPISIEEAKQHCYVTSTAAATDAVLSIAISAAREYVENHTWISVIPATYEYYLDAFPDIIELPKPPCVSVDSIKYIDSSGTEQTIDSGDYETDINSEPARIRPVGSWPDVGTSLNPVTVAFSAGYEKCNIPKQIKIGMLMLIKHLYDNRESVLMSEGQSVDIKEVPLSTKALIDPFSERVFV